MRVSLGRWLQGYAVCVLLHHHRWSQLACRHVSACIVSAVRRHVLSGRSRPTASSLAPVSSPAALRCSDGSTRLLEQLTEARGCHISVQAFTAVGTRPCQGAAPLSRRPSSAQRAGRGAARCPQGCPRGRCWHTLGTPSAGGACALPSHCRLQPPELHRRLLHCEPPLHGGLPYMVTLKHGRCEDAMAKLEVALEV